MVNTYAYDFVLNIKNNFVIDSDQSVIENELVCWSYMVNHITFYV